VEKIGVALHDGEHVVAKAKLHLAALISPIVVFLIGVIMYFVTPKDAELLQFSSLVLMAIGIWRTIHSLRVRRSTSLVLTNQRLIAENGPSGRTKLDVVIGHVDRVGAKRGPQARLMGYGNLVVTARGFGNQNVVFRHIADVEKLAQQIRDQMASQ